MFRFYDTSSETGSKPIGKSEFHPCCITKPPSGGSFILNPYFSQITIESYMLIGKNKPDSRCPSRTVEQRRYLDRVFCDLTYRCVCGPSESASARDTGSPAYVFTNLYIQYAVICETKTNLFRRFRFQIFECCGQHQFDSIQLVYFTCTRIEVDCHDV